MIVVSDTSPLTALLTVGQSEILPRLFGEVVIPKAVETELLRSHPTLPDWLQVRLLSDGAKAAVWRSSKAIDSRGFETNAIRSRVPHVPLPPCLASAQGDGWCPGKRG